MTQEQFEKFAASLIKRCQDLANIRSETTLIPPDKYEHVRDFVQFLVSDCYSIASTAIETGMVKEDQFLEIFFKYLYFFLSLTDRFAFSSIGDPGRHVLIDEIFEFSVILAIQSFFPRLTDDEKDKMFAECMDQLNMAGSEYSRFQKLYPTGDEGYGGTLFWEFSKEIALIAGEANNPASVIGHYNIIIRASVNLDINSFINKMI